MKISELITTLQTILASDGDVEVKLKAYDGGMNPWPVERISEVHNTRIIGEWNATANDWDKEPCNPFIVIESE